MVMADMEQPRKTFVLTRGLYNKPSGDEVHSRLPEFLTHAEQSGTANRLTLARWLVSDNNPLTARVTVNRFWQQLFGIGLVKTTEDFGSQGEIPVHRELLDWLAAEFRESGWDVKHLIKLMVTSHTYRQSSKISGDAYERDPDNRFLARGARYRMPSWMLRDQALAVSGLLSTVDHGPPSIRTNPRVFGKRLHSETCGTSRIRARNFIAAVSTLFGAGSSRQRCSSIAPQGKPARSRPVARILRCMPCRH